MENIIILGSGNLASNLAVALFNKGYCISQVYSRSLENAKTLATQVGAKAISNINELTQAADLYIIAVSDHAIDELVEKINFDPKAIVHTAGSVHISSLNKFSKHGVLYPLQTFTKSRLLSFKQIPICIEANSRNLKQYLAQLANSLSDNIHEIDSDKRKQCHIAAVFANNFTNHLYAISELLLKEKDLTFDLLKPIITETAAKIQNISPREAQTGPAVRNNIEVINQHKKLLSVPELENLYSFVSDSIIELHKNTNK